MHLMKYYHKETLRTELRDGLIPEEGTYTYTRILPQKKIKISDPKLDIFETFLTQRKKSQNLYIIGTFHHSENDEKFDLRQSETSLTLERKHSLLKQSAHDYKTHTPS